jgi:hypothetical protein
MAVLGRSVFSACLLPLTVGLVLAPAAAQTSPDLGVEITRLRDDIAAQRQRLAEQQRTIEQQQQRLDLLERRMSQPGSVMSSTGQPGAKAAQAPTQQVGQAPEARQQRPELPERPDIGGVLNPKGRLTLEPSFEYANSQLNRFFFSGAQIVDTVFIGGLDATNAKRNTLTAALTGRYGVTDRMQTDLRLPYVYRSDREAEGVNTDVLNRNVSGNDLGDIEATFHYQLNPAVDGRAIYVGNLRVKSDTGTGPFDVPVDAIGRQSRLPTGSGFWSIEPSLTALFATDPVVLYGNLGYAFSLDKDVNKTVGGNTFGNVSPGDALRATFGLGLALNDKVSVSLGYQHDWVQGTQSIVNGVKVTSEELQIGQFLVGTSYAFSPDYSLNMNLAVGATRDAPDVRLLFSVPIALDLFR